MPIALSIAGSDPTGGAGLELDLRIFQAHQVHGCAVGTALTVQDTERVTEIHPSDPALVARRIDVLLGDVVPDVIKIGMLATAPIVTVVADVIRDFDGQVPVVVDPVLISSSGMPLLEETGVAILRDRLLPLAHVATPNRAELNTLLGGKAPETAAVEALGSRWVVVTDGDGEGENCDDEVFGEGSSFLLSSPRIACKPPHGTGCALSSALAAQLALGQDTRTAIEEARRFVYAAIERSMDGGAGRLLVF